MTKLSEKETEQSVSSITLQSENTDQRVDPLLILNVVQADQFQVCSVQILSSSRLIEFYHREYLGTCQGSRITELENDFVYESKYDFHRPHDEITLKFLKLADASKLILYCLQINLCRRSTSVKYPLASGSALPFDMERVRSMIDETNLSSNARQFMTDLQQMQHRKRIVDENSQQFQLGQLMMMMKGISPSATTVPRETSSSNVRSSITEVKVAESRDVNDSIAQQLTMMENRLLAHFNRCFGQLQQQIDERFQQLEEKLNKLHEIR